jgi:hypothetical protein
MKRCPKCSFLYLDTDEVCDLDGTVLIQASEFDLEPSLISQSAPLVAEQHAAPSGSRRRLIVTGVAGLLLGVIPAVGYLMLMKSPPVDEHAIARISVPSSVVPLTVPTATPLPVPEVSSPSQPERPTASPSPNATKVTVSNNPVSTTANRNSGQGQAVIRLTNGARIDADEVWRTKEGVWYRRKGMVTLVRANQIRTIEKSARK